MRRPHLLFLALVAGVTLCGTFASAEITHTTSFEPSARTSLKIPDPPGAHVFVTVGREVKDDTTPAIFALPDADAYVTVKIVMSDGESWSDKVEIKAKQQTVLRFTQGKKGAPAPSAAAAARFTGRLVNTTDACDWPENVRFVVTRDGKQVFASALVFPGKEVSTVLESGGYFVQILDTSSAVLASRPLNAGRDGWMFPTGCVKTN
jgi:hypothetical protein